MPAQSRSLTILLAILFFFGGIDRLIIAVERLTITMPTQDNLGFTVLLVSRALFALSVWALNFWVIYRDITVRDGAGRSATKEGE